MTTPTGTQEPVTPGQVAPVVCRQIMGLIEIESEIRRLGHGSLADDLKQHIFELSLFQSRLEGKNEEQAELLKRSLAIIVEAIMHGMPITAEVAAVRNAIAGA